MPTTGPIMGHNLRIKIGTTTPAAIYAAKECKISISTDTTEINHKDNYSSSWKEATASVNSWSGSTSGLVYFDAANGIDDLIAFQIAKTKIKVEFSTGVSGDIKWTGDAYLTSAEVSASVGDVVSYSVSFTGTGALVQATAA